MQQTKRLRWMCPKCKSGVYYENQPAKCEVCGTPGAMMYVVPE
jgi:rubrerythrin